MVNGGGSARFLGLAFTMTVIAAIVALVAGYGVPVGIGALAGFILGALAGIIGALWLIRGAGRSLSLGGATWSSADRSGEVQPIEMAQMRERSELLQVDLGPIRTVLPALSTVDAEGYELQLVATEVHEGGLTILVDVRSQPGSLPPGFWADVTVRDAAGTPFRASGQCNGGAPNPMRYSIAVVPAPPAEARRLDLVIERFIDPFPGAGRRTHGPWHFVIELPRTP